MSTHTLPWAIKGCDFTKRNIYALSFGDDFDNLMQKMNYNETNGICIGPELSRIFAEIILQAVDLDVEEQALSRSLVIGRDYQCKRYVDDYILFAKDDETLNIINGIIEVCLKKYNLHLNESKYLKYDRPFMTSKSSIIHSAKIAINNFLEEKLTKKENLLIAPNKIFRNRAFEKSFLQTLKGICADHEVGYDAISDYAVSSIAKCIVRLTTDYDLIGKENRREESLYQEAFHILLKALFFLYSVNPTVSSSYQLGRSLIIVIRFVRDKMTDSYLSTAGLIHSLVSQFVKQCVNLEKATFQSKVPIEILNVILASRELGAPYLLDEDWLLNNVFDLNNMEYFSIVSCLYYIRDDAAYDNLRNAVESLIKKILGDCAGFQRKAHDAHLLLDVITCPYVSENTRFHVYGSLRSILNLPILDTASLTKYLAEIAEKPWFVQWDTVDVLNMLKKKELSAVY